MGNNRFENILLIVTGIIIVYLFIDNSRKNKEIKQLKKEIDENADLTKEIKLQLTGLVNNNEEIDPKVASELGKIIGLLDIKQDTTAIFKLAKIIENLLKELYEGDDELQIISKKNGRKKAVFADYIELAKSKKIISTEDFHLLSILKLIRNEEAHDLDIKKEKSSLIAVLISGIKLVLGLSRLIKLK